MGTGRRILRWTVGGLLLAMAAVSSAPSPRPGSIAVGGAFPNGYLGLLARNGLPRTVLSDKQLADPDVLAQYPLVIVAGLNGPSDGAADALREYVRNGGEVLFDYGPPPSGMLRPGMVAVQPDPDDPVQVSARSTSRLALLGDANPLTGVELDGIEPPRLFGFGFAPKLAADAKYTVLAEFEATSSLQGGFGLGGPRPPQPGGFGQPGFGGGGNRLFRQPGRRNAPADEPRDAPDAAPARAAGQPVPAQGGMFEPPFGGPGQPPRQRPDRQGMPGGPGGRPMRDTGPPAPAIVLEEVGRGKLLHCGPAIGLANVFGGVGYDDLVLRLLALVSDGRVKPQLEAEGVALKFGQTVADLRRSGRLDTAAGDTAAEEPPSRRAGSGPRQALPDGLAELETAIGGDFTLQAPRGDGALVVLLGYWSHAEHTLVEVNGTRTRVRVMTAGQADQEIGSPAAAVGGLVTIKLRGRELRIQAGGRTMSRTVDLPAGAVGIQGQRGEALYQPVDEPYFVDDFMRTDEHDGGWQTAGGKWHTVAADQVEGTPNAFSLKVEPQGAATAAQGQWFWDDYRFTVAAQPQRDGTRLGLDLYLQENGDGLRFEAPVGDHAGGLQVVLRSQGQRKVLATGPGRLRAGQWYRLAFAAQGAKITALVDDIAVLEAADSTFAGGRFGLWTDGPAQFDDVRVTATEVVDNRVVQLPPALPDSAGTIDVNSWAGMAEPWLPEPGQAGLFWRRGLFGDGAVFRYDGPLLPDGASLSLMSHADGVAPASGLSLTAARHGDQTDCTVAVGGKVVTSSRLAAGERLVLSLSQRGPKVVAATAGGALAEVSAPRGQRLGFIVRGWTPRISSFSVSSSGVLDETFEQAPVRWWVGSGTWALTNRWSCSPEWSWLGGTSDEEAVLWTKRSVRGNHVLDFYAGPKMSEASGQAALGEDPAAPGPLGRGGRPGGLRDHLNSERVGDFNATLCGNGQDARSGYAVLIGSKQGGVRLYREGEQVAANLDYELFVHTDNQVLDFFRGHNRWYHIEVEKDGATVRVRIENQTVLSYTDPAPLEGGQAAIWTQANGIMIPRVSLYQPAAGLPATEL